MDFIHSVINFCIGSKNMSENNQKQEILEFCLDFAMSVNNILYYPKCHLFIQFVSFKN